MDSKEHDNQELLMYILVNENLLNIPNMIGKISAQVGHVVGDYVHDIRCFENCWLKNKPYEEHPSLEDCDLDNYYIWYYADKKKIVLKAPLKLLEELEDDYWSIRDNGLTKIPSNTLTAICLGVDTRENFLKRTPKLKRLRLL